MTKQLITQEEFTNIQELQAGATKLIQKASKRGKFLRVMRNNQPLAVLIPTQMWEDLLEDFEALSNPGYLERIAKSRKSNKRYSAEEIEAELEIE